MKRLPFLALVVVMAVCFFAFKKQNVFSSEPKDKYEKIMMNITELLRELHFSPKNINDQFSEKVFTKYINDIDPERNVLLKTDVDSLSKLYKNYIDDEMYGAPLKSFKGVYTIFKKRSEEAEKIKNELIKKPIDYTIKDSLILDEDRNQFPQNNNERKDAWRKRIKYLSLDRYADYITRKNEGKADADIKGKTDAQLEQLARTKADTLLNRYFNRNKVKFNEDDNFDMYINAITTTMDPHTRFFAPVEKRTFDEEMSGYFYGIGALLEDAKGQVRIVSINTGGAAQKSGQIQPGDIIQKVGEGNNPPVDITGYYLPDAIKLIKGKQGSIVSLTMKKEDGSLKVVKMKREKVDNADVYVKSAIINDKENNKKIGIIYLPEFYVNINEKDGRRSFTDVANEVEILKKDNVDGIIMDLRNNGGGSLPDVVEMLGVFIDQGPMVQIKSRFEGTSILPNSASKTAMYNGPLAVLINQFSASASEIFAGAIQDYGRGIILGSTSTFGKGTVQRNVPVNFRDRTGSEENDLGALKITLSKFYRISGGSTQLKGVESDVVLPDIYELRKVREKDDVDALPYDVIKTATYKKWVGATGVEEAKKMANDRVAHDSSFVKIARNTEWLGSRNDKNYTLNLKEYFDERKTIEDKVKGIEGIVKLKKPLDVQIDKRLELADSTNQIAYERTKFWAKIVSEDIYINQAVQSINDLQKIMKLTAAVKKD